MGPAATRDWPLVVLGQAGTPTTTAPTPAPPSNEGYALAALAILVFFAGAAVVIGGGVVVAGYGAVRGSLFTVELGPRQRQLFAVGAGALLLAVGLYVVDPGTFGVLVVALLGIGGLAVAAGTVWVLTSGLRGWLRDR